MTRSEQERLVSRYLNGELGAAEEQDFFIQVAVDNELRQTLKAFRVVDSAIQKSRESSAMLHAESRNRLVGMLNLPHAPAAPAYTAAETSAGARSLLQGGSGLLMRFRQAVLSPLTYKMAIAATALMVGTFGVAPILEKNSPDETVQPPAAAPARALETTGGIPPNVVNEARTETPAPAATPVTTIPLAAASDGSVRQVSAAQRHGKPPNISSVVIRRPVEDVNSRNGAPATRIPDAATTQSQTDETRALSETESRPALQRPDGTQQIVREDADSRIENPNPPTRRPMHRGRDTIKLHVKFDLP